MKSERMRAAAAALAGVALAAAVPAAPAVAADDTKSAKASLRLEELGLGYEDARALAGEERAAALEGIAAELDAILGKELPAHRRPAGYFLAAELRRELDAPGAAAGLHGKAERAAKDDPIGAAAAFAAIRAMEEAGDDAGAAKEWGRWLEKHPRSPLRPEAQLALTWNSVRRDTLAAADKTLETLAAEAPWMDRDPRRVLAEGTVRYLQKQPAEALAVLGDDTPGAGAAYLRALCYRDQGDMLKSAARFQEVVERYPDSPLRDLALLAKADVFLASRAWKSAAEEFARVAAAVRRDDVRAEAELRHAAAVFLDGNADLGVAALRAVTADHAGTGAAARAQYLLGEVLFTQARYEEAIVEFNRVLGKYFDHALAARAQYRVGRSLDALGRSPEATSAYQTVVSGYTQSPESPAAAYLAGVGLLEAGRPLVAAPYFQIVLDRYARDGGDAIVFARPEHQELVEASLCLLQLSYHGAGDLGQLSGVPHILLGRMPRSASPWRSFALLIDADALASLARYDEARAALESLIAEFPSQPVVVPANRLLAWTYARQGEDALAIATEERMLDRYADLGDDESLAEALLHKAHIRFNEKRYADAARAYDELAARFPDHAETQLALYQSGLSHLRLGNTGDAVDRWEAALARDPASETAAKAWARAGDLYFRAEKFDDAERCFRGLIANFDGTDVQARASLRIAQCQYNAGRDAEALELFSELAVRYAGTPSGREAERGIELALYRLGQGADGELVLAQLVEKHPTSSFAADAQFEIALRRYDRKEYGEAADEFRRVVTQFPSFSAVDRAHYLMGDSYERAGNAADARGAYEQFLHFFPSSEFGAPVRFRLGTLRYEAGDLMQAAVDFTAVLEQEISAETRQAALYNLALCQISLERPEEAVATLARFRSGQAAGDPRAADVAYRLGDLHERSMRWEAAIEEYNRALKADPEKSLAVELHYRIGTSREQLQDQDGAIIAYGKAAGVGARSDAYHLSAVARLAALYESREDWVKAVRAYKDLIRDAKDPELVAAARDRVEQLAAVTQ
jgi:TolA-binding protein